MIEWLLPFFIRRRFVGRRQPSQGITEHLKVQGRVADYLIRVEREVSDTVKFDGVVSDWVVKYVPPDYLPIGGRTDEYCVKVVEREVVKIGGLVWVYTVSRKTTDVLTFRCYIKTYKS